MSNYADIHEKRMFFIQKRIKRVMDLCVEYDDGERAELERKSRKDEVMKTHLEKINSRNYKSEIPKLLYDLFEREFDVLLEEIERHCHLSPKRKELSILDPISRIPITSKPIKLKLTGVKYDYCTINIHFSRLEKDGKVSRCPVSRKVLSKEEKRAKVNKTISMKRDEIYNYSIQFIPVMNLFSEYLRRHIPFGGATTPLLSKILETKFSSILIDIFTLFILINRSLISKRGYEPSISLLLGIEGVISVLAIHQDSFLRIHCACLFYLGYINYRYFEDPDKTEKYLQKFHSSEQYRFCLKTWDGIDTKIEYDRSKKSYPDLFESLSAQDKILAVLKDSNRKREEFLISKLEFVLKALVDCFCSLKKNRECMDTIEIYVESSFGDVREEVKFVEEYLRKHFPESEHLLDFYLGWLTSLMEFSNDEIGNALFRVANFFKVYEIEKKQYQFEKTCKILKKLGELRIKHFGLPIENIRREMRRIQNQNSDWMEIMKTTYRVPEGENQSLVDSEIVEKVRSAVERKDLSGVLRLTKSKLLNFEEEKRFFSSLFEIERNIGTILVKMEENRKKVGQKIIASKK